MPKLLQKLNFYNILFLLTVSFSLGSLWALYQSVWGYYWSSDYIELILIYNIIVCLNLFHKIKIKSKNRNNVILNTIIILMFLRLNLVYTKHSFFNNKKQIIYLLQFYLLFYLINNIFINKNYSLNLTNKDGLLTILVFIIVLNKYNLKLLQNIIEIFSSFLLLFFLLKILKLKKNKIIHLIFFILILTFLNIKFNYFITIHNKSHFLFKSNLTYYYNFKNIKINIWKIFLKFKYNWKSNYHEIKDINIIYFSKNKKNMLINYI